MATAPAAPKSRKWLYVGLGCGGATLLTCGGCIALYFAANVVGGPGGSVAEAPVPLEGAFELSYTQSDAQAHDVWLTLDLDLTGTDWHLRGPLIVEIAGQPSSLYTLRFDSPHTSAAIVEVTSSRQANFSEMFLGHSGTVSGKLLLFHVPAQAQGTTVRIYGEVRGHQVGVNELRLTANEPSMGGDMLGESFTGSAPPYSEHRHRLARAFAGIGDTLASGVVMPLAGAPVPAQGTPPANVQDALLSVGWKRVDGGEQQLFHLVPFRLDDPAGPYVVAGNVIAVSDLRSTPSTRHHDGFQRVDTPDAIVRGEFQGARLFGTDNVTILGTVTDGSQGPGFYGDIEIALGPVETLLRSTFTAQ